MNESNIALMHYGIKGQKRGQRRFQNEDGTLTPEGKERYNKGHGRIRFRRTDNTKKAAGITNKRNIKDMSDDELNREINRKTREEQYKRMNESQIKREAKQIAKESFKRIFIATATTLAVAAMTKQYKNAQSKIGEYAHHKISNIRQNDSTKQAIKSAVSRYSQNGPKTRFMNSNATPDWKLAINKLKKNM